MIKEKEIDSKDVHSIKNGKSISTSLFRFCLKYDEWPSLGVRDYNNEMNGLIENESNCFLAAKYSCRLESRNAEGQFLIGFDLQIH